MIKIFSSVSCWNWFWKNLDWGWVWALLVTLVSVSSDGDRVVGVTVRCDGSVTSVGCLSHMSILIRPVDERVMPPLKIKCVIAVIVMVVGGWVMRWILMT